MFTSEIDKGIIISFDGLDSTGKNTQSKKLIERLRTAGWPVRIFETPDYTTPSGKELKLRLQHKLGDWNATPWQEKMKYFAINRAEHREEVLEALANKEIIIYDRYIPSSMAFMATEGLTEEEVEQGRAAVYAAVEHEEYVLNAMPKEDASIFLDVPPQVSTQLLEKRKEDREDEDEYTDHISIQQRMYNEYDYMTTNDPKRFLRITCVEDGKLLAKEDVAELIWSGLVERFPFLNK